MNIVLTKADLKNRRRKALTLLGGVVVLQPRLNRLVLLVELGHVRDEVLDNVHYSEMTINTRF